MADVRARGGYGDDVGDGPLHAPQTDARIRFRPELSYSSKPVVGPPLTAVKRVLLRLNVHAFDDLARQVDQAVVDAEIRLDDLLERVEGIEATLQRLPAAERGSRGSSARPARGAQRRRARRQARDHPLPSRWRAAWTISSSRPGFVDLRNRFETVSRSTSNGCGGVARCSTSAAGGASSWSS